MCEHSSAGHHPPTPPSNRLGTIDYIAPEVLECPQPTPNGLTSEAAPMEGSSDKGYTSKIDCWSVGVMAYELLEGKGPFTVVRARPESGRLIRALPYLA